METQILADEPQRAFSTALRACATMDCTGTRTCPSSAFLRAASRVNPTCGVKPGNDGGEAVAGILRPFFPRGRI
jgi:hypothetical protein